MAISRKQYISVAELNEITGSSFADNTETLQLIYEASEIIAHHTLGKSDYVTDEASVNGLKLATGYQVQYLSDNAKVDSDYDVDDSVSLGRFSYGGGSSASKNSEWKKIAPKTNRYLMDIGLLYRGADTTYGGYFD